MEVVADVVKAKVDVAQQAAKRVDSKDSMVVFGFTYVNQWICTSRSAGF